MPRYSARSPERITPKGIENAENKGDNRRHSHEHIHACCEMTQLFPSRDIELPATENHTSEGNNEHSLVGNICIPHSNPAHRHRHTEQRQHPRQHHLAAQEHETAMLNLLDRAVIFYHEVVSGSRHLVLHLLQRDYSRVIFHLCRASRQRYGHIFNTVETTQFALHIGRTNSTHHSDNRYILLLHISYFIYIIMQAECKRIYSQLLRRSLSYAKVRLFSCTPVANSIKKYIKKARSR